MSSSYTTRDLTFRQLLKKFELSLRSGMMPEVMKYLSALIEAADEEYEEDIVEELGSLIAESDEEDFEVFFDEVYDTLQNPTQYYKDTPIPPTRNNPNRTVTK